MSHEKGCSICKDPVDSENPIIKCEKCDLQVHIMCYGIKDVDNFVCSPCNAEAGVVQCSICAKPGGALKKTTDDRWAHVLCALFTANSRFTDQKSMEPIDITNVKQPRKKLPCVFCHDSFGTFKCCYKSCTKALHAPCGFENNSLVELAKENDKLIFLGYCDTHATSQAAPKKRLSSEGLNVAIRLKTQKQNIARANKENSDWILKKYADSQATEEIDEPSSTVANAANENRDLPSGSHMDDIGMPNPLNFLEVSIHDITPESNSMRKPTSSETPNISVLPQKYLNSGTSTRKNVSTSFDDNANEEKDQSKRLVRESNDRPNHECYKDSVIEKLRYETCSLKIEYEALKVLNSELHAQIRQKLKSSPIEVVGNVTVRSEQTLERPQVILSTDNESTLTQLVPEPASAAIQEIATSTQLVPATHELSTENEGVTCENNDDLLKNIPTGEASDSKFVNALFDATLQNISWDTLFSNDEINDKKKAKQKFQTTAQYHAMKGIYEKRVESDGPNAMKRKKEFPNYVKRKIDDRIYYINKSKKRKVAEKEAAEKGAEEQQAAAEKQTVESQGVTEEELTGDTSGQISSAQRLN